MQNLAIPGPEPTKCPELIAIDRLRVGMEQGFMQIHDDIKRSFSDLKLDMYTLNYQNVSTSLCRGRDAN